MFAIFANFGQVGKNLIRGNELISSLAKTIRENILLFFFISKFSAFFFVVILFSFLQITDLFTYSLTGLKYKMTFAILKTRELSFYLGN